ncbi:hypothetical protein V8F06_011079 [Rhypophila decipiens]
MNPNIGASFLSAKNENVLAFANVTADFALVKIEVPYQRLGLLFEHAIPDIKDLIEAYGTRSSEIAKSSKLESKIKDYGPFAGHAGIDGTSIYAAASSGPSVLALHLLACMLVRIFSGAEATAIWVQLIESRLREIEQQADTSQLRGLAALYAAEHGRQIQRSELAEWDASARAWLETADQVKRREHTQLKLIVKNIPSIQQSSTTYANVVDNWVTAMHTAQKSLQGVPQDVSNGAVLLGLMAWHIYPDLNVFSRAPNGYVKFGDTLVKSGGVITLGLEQKDKGAGVTWSMSLSHLRFYGAPVIVEKSSADGDRITAQELGLVCLGCLISSWENPSQIDICEAADCLVALAECIGTIPAGDAAGYSDSDEVLEDDAAGYSGSDEGLEDDAAEYSDSDEWLEWLAPLLSAAKHLASSKDRERENALYLVEFGRRRGRNFLDTEFNGVIPMFGLTNPLLLHMALSKRPEMDVEKSIRVLRQLAADCHFHRDDCIIISRPQCYPKVSAPNSGGDILEPVQGSWEVASAIPAPAKAGKRDADGKERATARHFRWIHVNRAEDVQSHRMLETQERGISRTRRSNLKPWDPNDIENSNSDHFDPIDMEKILLEEACNCKERGQACGDECLCRAIGFTCTSACSCVSSFMGLNESLACSNIRPCTAEADPPGEDCFWLSARSTLDISDLPSARSNLQFKWRDPPNVFLERYCRDHKGKANDSDLGTSPIDSETGTVDYRDIFSNFKLTGLSQEEDDWLEEEAGWLEEETVFLEEETGSLEEETIPLKEEAVSLEENVTNAPYRVNSVGSKVSFQTIAICGGAGLTGAIGKRLMREYLVSVGEQGVTDFTKSTLGDLVFSRLFFTSLRAMCAISELYRDWPGATISIGVTKKPLGLAHWAASLENTRSRPLKSRLTPTRELGLTPTFHRFIKFSCLIMLESGGHSIHPDQLELVMALAAGNSIYTSECLVQDPFIEDQSGKRSFRGIKRILGSLGHPGVVLLIPPSAPLAMEVESGLSRFSQAETFDGTPSPGAIDADVVMREALVSVFNGPRWIADLDILQTLSNENLRRLRGKCEPTHGKANGRGLSNLLAQDMGAVLKSIGTWEELLACKENLLLDEAGAIRAHGNWYARLAAASLCVQLGCRITLFPTEDVCVNCGQTMMAEMKLNNLDPPNESPCMFII